MSLQEFWTNVQIGAWVIAPTITAVDGFDEADFDFLTDTERQKLAECVQGFRGVASRVPGNGPAPPAMSRQALAHFRGILEVLRPDKYSDPESLRIGKWLERDLAGSLPNWVHDLRVETGNDANGDPAVWIFVEVEDEAAGEDVFSTNAQIVRKQLDSALRRRVRERWPYIRFRTVSENREFATHNHR